MHYSVPLSPPPATPSPPPIPADALAQLNALRDRLQQQVDRVSEHMNATLSIGVVGTLFGVVNAEVKVAAGANDYTNPHGSRIDTGTIFPLGSATKMFSATSVMRLAEQGNISLDETVQPYIDQYLSRTLPCGGLPADP